MKEFELSPNSGLLIEDRLIRNYFTGIDVAEGWLLLSDTPAYFTDARYFSAAKEKIAPLGIKPVLYEGLESIKNEIDSQGIKKIYLDYDRTTLTAFEEYKGLNVELDNGVEFIKSARAIKSEDELADISKACEIIQRAYHESLKIVKKGITETELRNEIIRLMKEYGAEGESFDTIVGFGENGAVPHHETGDTKLKDNMCILVDTGCKYHGYCSDLTRMAFYGTPDEKFLTHYKAVLDANTKAEEQIVSGMKSNDADKIARDVLSDAGFGKLFTHSLGHGVGLEIHEFPWLSPKKSNDLEDGMVFTIEPGVYIDGEFGIRIEDTVMLENGKVKRLFTDEKELIIIK